MFKQERLNVKVQTVEDLALFETLLSGPAGFLESSMVGGRDANDYKNRLDVNLAELAGKLVLDLGSGLYTEFAHSVPDLTVISINPNWYAGKPMDESADAWNADGKCVAAIAQHLPFKDESFDSIVSMWSVPYYLPVAGGHANKCMSEIARVLKPDGTAHIFPVQKRLSDNQSFRDTADALFGTVLWDKPAEDWPAMSRLTLQK